MKYLLVLFLIFLSFEGFSQETKAEHEGGNAVFAKKFMEMLYAYVDVKAMLLKRSEEHTSELQSP